MERGAAALMLLVTVIFIFLSWDVAMGDSYYCTGGEISDDGTHSGYVAVVLSELATVTPTTPTLQHIAAFPRSGTGYVLGSASCSDHSNVGLWGLQQLLAGSCSAWTGGYAAADQSVCTMAFGTP